MERVSKEMMEGEGGVVQELGACAGRCISEFFDSTQRKQVGTEREREWCVCVYVELARTGVHRALIDRAAATGTCEVEVIEVSPFVVT